MSGRPGTAFTSKDGSKMSVAPTDQEAYDALNADIKTFEASLKKQEKKLKSKDKNAIKAANKEVKRLNDLIKARKDSKLTKRMVDLVGNFGLDPVR